LRWDLFGHFDPGSLEELSLTNGQRYSATGRGNCGNRGIDGSMASYAV